MREWRTRRWTAATVRKGGRTMGGGGPDGGRCLWPPMLTVDLALAVVDGAIAIAAFSQMLRIHLCDRKLGWTRQKIFHLIIGSSSLGFTIYFISIPIATCSRWLCWSHVCGFVLMACPEILFLAAFLLLLSFWVDLCHQANDKDDDEDENGYTENLLEKTKTKLGESHGNRRRTCLIFPPIHMGRRQKIVFLVVLFTFLFMVASTVLIWIGKGKNHIDSSLMTLLYLDTFSAVMLLLGGALACYGGLLFSKMSKVRSETVSSEMWKELGLLFGIAFFFSLCSLFEVASLAVVSLVCFTTSSILALVTNAPVMPTSRTKLKNSVNTSVILFLYYLTGTSVPSAFVLWVMREMPPRHARESPARARIVTFVREESTMHYPHSWTTAAPSTIQTSKVSPTQKKPG